VRLPTCMVEVGLSVAGGRGHCRGGRAAEGSEGLLALMLLEKWNGAPDGSVRWCVSVCHPMSAPLWVDVGRCGDACVVRGNEGVPAMHVRTACTATLYWQYSRCCAGLIPCRCKQTSRKCCRAQYIYSWVMNCRRLQFPSHVGGVVLGGVV
jgi:hypothetical protein